MLAAHMRYLLITFHSTCPSVITRTASVLTASVSRSLVSASAMVTHGATPVRTINQSSAAVVVAVVSDLLYSVWQFK